MSWKKISLFCMFVAGVGLMYDAVAATAKVAKQSAIQSGTKVRTKVEVTGLYDQECYDSFYGCMDQFCISDNENGGSCACSDLNAEYETQLAEIKKILEQAEYISTVEVEKVQAGADADIIFKGTRQYDEDGNLIDVDELTEEEKKKQKRESLMALFEKSYDEDEDVFSDDSDEDIFSKTGAALHKAAENLCIQQVPEKCEKDIAFLRQVYGRQITSDCKGFKNSLDAQRKDADKKLASAEAAVRSALKDSLAESNKYDLGTCMVEFKKCMLTDDACGKDWTKCVSTIADVNMQGIKENDIFESGNMSKSAQKAYTGSTYGIAASTMEGLDSKRLICERVLDKCVAVRDQVWPAFLREAAPTIKVAELSAESKMRQSCLTDISDCIQTACKDDIEGKGVASMDACLARPDMARSFCKIEIERCEKMEPQIWAYVTDKLKAMRVDVCTQEVKDCFTADTRCGANFQNCIGMDYDYIHDMCPIDSLVVCKQDNPNFSMSDLDSMLMGLYLNIDNSALDQCQALVDAKMLEICGSTTDCNKFAADDVIGTGSLRSQKDGTIYRVTGMISFGSIKMGDAFGTTDNSKVLKAGQIGVEDYLAHVLEVNENVPDKDAIISSIEAELNNIAGTINRTIQMIEQDPEIQFCVNGRDLSQITGNDGEKTTARFPNLLNSVKMQIATAALRQAQDNYNKKFTEAVAQATKDASADIAQYMCQMLPTNHGATIGGVSDEKTKLTAPYAISYEVGSGLEKALLAQGGRGSGATSETAVMESGRDTGDAENIISSILTLGWSTITGDKVKQEIPGGTREMWSVFNRETRICHFCTSTVTKTCKTVHKKGFLGIGATDEMDCKESQPVEKCEDIPM